jgi:RNA-directed DNA polymerase (EC 2.7.7.49)
MSETYVLPVGWKELQGDANERAIAQIHFPETNEFGVLFDAATDKGFLSALLDNHKALLDKINTYPGLRNQIKSWLKSGVLDQGEIFPTKVGTPQGGVISPLLANIALHGMEERVKQFVGNSINQRREISLIRYADDFVIMHKDIEVILACQKIIAEWLGDIGLELKPSKTKLTHTLNEYNGNIGFEFLGFHIQQHKVGIYRSAKSTKGIPLGFKTLITPSKPKVKAHLAKIEEVIDTHSHSPQYALIKRLNPIIRGWSNYYSTVVSKTGLVFEKVRVSELINK